MSEAIDRLRLVAADPRSTRWKRPKYRPGKPYAGVDDFLAHSYAGGWSYTVGLGVAPRPYAPGFVLSWQVGFVAGMIRRGALVRAEENQP